MTAATVVSIVAFLPRVVLFHTTYLFKAYNYNLRWAMYYTWLLTWVFLIVMVASNLFAGL